MIELQHYKQIPKFPAYWVSSSGRVFKRINITHPERRQWTEIKPFESKGVMRVNVGKKFTISRLVYSLFVGEISCGMVICHLNGNFRDNRVENLHQGTQKENISHKRIHGTWQSCENHPHAVLSNDTALKVKRAIDDCKNPATGRLKRGSSYVIAKKFGVTVQSVYSISRARASYAELFEC